MQSKPLLPDRERMSALMAVILLSYALARFIQLPGQVMALQLAGIYLPLQVDINTAIAVLVAALTAAGTDWLLQSGEGLLDRSRYRHWLLPAMTAWVLSLLLANLPFDARWWLALALSAALLLPVILAEFASSSEGHRYQQIATQALSLLTLGLFLILAITVRATALRLFIALPTIAIGLATAVSRLQLLQPGQRWQWLPVVGLTFVGIQLAAALQYLPVNALAYGLALLGLLYSLNHYVAAVNADEDVAEARREALIALGLFWLMALILR